MSSTPKRLRNGFPIPVTVNPPLPPISLIANLFRNFRRNANRLLAGVAGCSHLTELCAVLPTAAIQAFAGDVWNVREEGRGAGPWRRARRSAFPARRCRALRFDGEVVRQYYPRWYGASRPDVPGEGSTKE